MTPNKQFEIKSVDCGGYENMTVSQSDIHNMQRGKKMMLFQIDVVLVVDKFEANKASNESFYYSILRHDSSIPIFIISILQIHI